MQHLEWSDALALKLPAMDDTHREFVDLLAAVNTATDGTGSVVVTLKAREPSGCTAPF